MNDRIAYIIILVTCASREEAEEITQVLVAEKLIACGNIVPSVQSIFFWQGKVSNENESLILAKSTRDHFPTILKRVKSLHSYTVPEIIALPVIEGSPDYLEWISSTVRAT